MRGPTTRGLMSIVAFIGLVFGGIAWCERSIQNAFTVENRSGRTIARLRVTAAYTTFEFKDIPDGEDVYGTFVITGDSDFAVAAKLADGAEINGRYGYFTNGMFAERVRLTIVPGGKVDSSQ